MTHSFLSVFCLTVINDGVWQQITTPGALSQTTDFDTNSVIRNGLVEPFSNLTSVDLGVFASGATNPATVTFFESGVTRDQLAEKQSLDKMLRLKAGNGLQFHHYSDSSKTLPDDHWSQGTTQISTTGVAFNRLSPSKRVEKRQPHLDFT